MSNPECKCPPMPAWLKELHRLRSDDHEAYKQMPHELRELYSIYWNAKQRCGISACELAERLESGDVPGGPNLGLAISWHRYAVGLGSAASAVRLAKLLKWSKLKKLNLEAPTMAIEALKRVLTQSFRDQQDWTVAASAALFLLNDEPSFQALLLVEELLDGPDFADHPDRQRIADLLLVHTLKRDEQPANGLEHQVVQGKISGDGEFKVGVYAALEKQMPLVPAPPDPEFVLHQLNLEFPWFANVNAEVYKQLVVAGYGEKPAFRLRPLLLAGPPGVGKTTWAKRLAELCVVPIRTIMAGGGMDNMFLRGTPRGWASARPGAVLQLMATEATANPIMVVDEIEKASVNTTNGRLWDVLLQLIEPATARAYLDECLQVPCDLTWVTWIATANILGALPRPLLERFTVVLVQKPGPEHFGVLAAGVMRNFAAEMGMDERMLPAFGAEDLEVLRRCKSPREINRVGRMMIEERLIHDRANARRN